MAPSHASTNHLPPDRRGTEPALADDERVGMDVEITEVTDDVAALSFQGPNTRKV
jgi:glycine cleavage system aminomethyltransferase T